MTRSDSIAELVGGDSTLTDYAHGWYKLCYVHELIAAVTPVAVAGRECIVVRLRTGFRVFRAACPHRGAHLGTGVLFDESTITCPFHHFKIHLGATDRHQFHAAEYASVTIGDIIFIRLSECLDCGFTESARLLSETHVLQPGFTRTINAPAPVIIENGFDAQHFEPIHGVCTMPSVPAVTCRGSLVAKGSLVLRESPGGTGRDLPFTLEAFSPGLSVLHFHGDSPYGMIIGATPTAPRRCVLRVSLLFPTAYYGDNPPTSLKEHLLLQSRSGIEADCVIWESLTTSCQYNLTAGDEGIRRFMVFCQKFRKSADRE